MVALTLTTLLVSLAFPVVNGYVRMATAVGGDVVLGAGNLTQGGKVGLYTVLLQVGRHAVRNGKKSAPQKRGPWKRLNLGDLFGDGNPALYGRF